MVDTAITRLILGKDVPYRQSQMPDYQYGSFVADDTDNHDLKMDGRGKGRLTVAVDNPANQSVVVTVYGMHAAAGAVGDVGTFQIGTFTVTAVEDKEYQTINDPFPWYLVRLAYGVAPDDSPLKTCTVYTDFSAF